jgi:hypothetical protein
VERALATTFTRFHSVWGFVKDRVFVPSLPAKLIDLRTRITPAITVIDNGMLLYKESDRYLITGLMFVVLRVEHILNICDVPEKKLASFPFHQY